MKRLCRNTRMGHQRGRGERKEKEMKQRERDKEGRKHRIIDRKRAKQNIRER
jgi:hypothetical protein